jgi:UDP-N-acetyl-2-amino-2-deoxyglucuronate dehydrogenase
MDSKISFAIVGCGRIAQRHAEHIAKLGILKAVCDIDFVKAQVLANKYGANAYHCIEDLLISEGELNVVSICSPNGLHAKHSILSLNAGFHVLCEKPMAINVYDCGEMIKAAEKNNRRLFAIKQNRFNPPVVAIKEMIDRGDLGKIYSVQLSCFWNRNFDYYHNSWKGTADLGMIGDVKTIHALSSNFAHQGVIEFEDTGVVALQFYNGALGTINYTVNSYGKNMEGSLTIFAEKGTVKIGGQYLNELEYQNIEGLVIKDLPAGNTANNYGQYQGSMSNHDKVYKNVIDVLENGSAISTNSFEGLKTVDIIDKIYQSAKRNQI